MLAALLFQSPIVAALLLVICGLLLGYALGTGRMHDTDTLASVITSLNRQQVPVPPDATPEETVPAVCPAVEEPLVSSLSTELTTVHHSLALVEEDRAELLEALQSAHEELANVHEDLESHRRALDTVERYRNELRDELTRERELLQASQARVHEHDDLQSRFDAANDELSELRRHNTYLQCQLTAAHEEHRHVQLEWKTSNGEAQNYLGEIESLQRQVRVLEREAASVRAERESVLESLRSAQEQNRQLTQRIGDQDLHARQTEEELEALYVQRAYWESADHRLRLDPAHDPTVPTTSMDAVRVQELEELVTTLKEQLRLVQLQAQEMVLRYQEAIQVETRDDAGQLERDRLELLQRIRQQSHQPQSQEEAA